MKNPICFALDFPNVTDAEQFVYKHRIHELVGAVKVGLELFTSSGPHVVKLFSSAYQLPVVLDLKLHDIPETVERAVKVGGDLGAKFMTLHIQQHETIQRAVKAAEPYGMQLLGVTVLTSMAPLDCEQLLLSSPDAEPGTCDIRERVKHLADFGRRYGLTGFVCSPREVGVLRRDVVPDGFFLVPGIRPAGAAVGDQKRIGTPAQAIKDGSDLLVIGRPIRDAAEPAAAIHDILREIEEARS